MLLDHRVSFATRSRITNPRLISCDDEVLEEVFVVTSTVKIFVGYPRAFVFVVFSCKRLQNPTRTNISKIQFLVDNVMYNSLVGRSTCFQNEEEVMNARNYRVLRWQTCCVFPRWRFQVTLSSGKMHTFEW